MAKRPAKGRQQLHSKKNTRTQSAAQKDKDIDWNISSDEDLLEMDSVSDHSEEEETPVDLETPEEKKLRLAKEYLDKVRVEEEEEESSEDEGVEERIEKRLQREAEEVN